MDLPKQRDVIINRLELLLEMALLEPISDNLKELILKALDEKDALE